MNAIRRVLKVWSLVLYMLFILFGGTAFIPFAIVGKHEWLGVTIFFIVLFVHAAMFAIFGKEKMLNFSNGWIYKDWK